jgi:hypothetical protein
MTMQNDPATGLSEWCDMMERYTLYLTPERLAEVTESDPEQILEQLRELGLWVKWSDGFSNGLALLGRPELMNMTFRLCDCADREVLSLVETARNCGPSASSIKWFRSQIGLIVELLRHVTSKPRAATG